MGLSQPSGLSCQGIPGNAFPIILLIIKPPGQIGFCGTLYRNILVFCNYDTFNAHFGKSGARVPAPLHFFCIMLYTSPILPKTEETPDNSQNHTSISTKSASGSALYKTLLYKAVHNQQRQYYQQCTCGNRRCLDKRIGSIYLGQPFRIALSS